MKKGGISMIITALFVVAIVAVVIDYRNKQLAKETKSGACGCGA